MAERKKNWPTKARREARELELSKRREMAKVQSIRDKAKAQKEREEKQANEAKVAKAQQEATAETKLEKQQRKAEKLRKQLEKAEKKLQESIRAGSKRKRDVGDDGDEDGNADNVKQGADTTAAPGAKDGSDSDDSDDSGSDSDSDDSGPEAKSSHGIHNVTLPPRAPVPRPCKYFSNGGNCGKKGKCRFLHDQSVRDAALKEKAKGGRMTLSERLQQNEREKQELTVLKAIKYAAEHGLLEDPSTVSAEQEVKGNADMDWKADVKAEAVSEDQTDEPQADEPFIKLEHLSPIQH